MGLKTITFYLLHSYFRVRRYIDLVLLFAVVRTLTSLEHDSVARRCYISMSLSMALHIYHRYYIYVWIIVSEKKPPEIICYKKFTINIVLRNIPHCCAWINH